jgi:hypothetical protein
MSFVHGYLETQQIPRGVTQPGSSIAVEVVAVCVPSSETLDFSRGHEFLVVCSGVFSMKAEAASICPRLLVWLE